VLLNKLDGPWFLLPSMPAIMHSTDL